MAGRLACEPVVGALAAGPHERRSLVDPLGPDHTSRRSPVEHDDELVVVAFGPSAAALDEFVLGNVRP
jgi:hypothetical protein